MKIKITEEQYKKIVNELKIKDKKMLGHGVEHDIFPSEKNPNVIYKVGNYSTIKELKDFIDGGPEFFPKLYGMRKLSSDKFQRDDIYFLILEKLDTKSFVEKCGKIFPIMDKYELFKSFRHYECFIVVKKYLEDEELREFCDKVVKLLSGMKRTFGNGPFFDFDLHKYNFGIDRNGDVKCLDL